MLPAPQRRELEPGLALTLKPQAEKDQDLPRKDSQAVGAASRRRKHRTRSGSPSSSPGKPLQLIELTNVAPAHRGVWGCFLEGRGIWPTEGHPSQITREVPAGPERVENLSHQGICPHSRLDLQLCHRQPLPREERLQCGPQSPSGTGQSSPAESFAFS
ncbi:hypothetical protein CB1_000216038 [Camelus ferus]|nr:hypothetical protein CB1_000216038 [Camelus ferus]